MVTFIVQVDYQGIYWNTSNFPSRASN